MRITIERARDGGPPWHYRGAAHLPEKSHPIDVTLAADGTATVGVAPSGDGAAPPTDLAERVRLIVRTAFRQAASDGQLPARRIVRWRAADKKDP